MTTPLETVERHPVCRARGKRLNKARGYGDHEDNLSGHDYEWIDGEGFDAVLKCQVCGWVSGPDFEGYVQ
jgi:hypothetical protein